MLFTIIFTIFPSFYNNSRRIGDSLILILQLSTYWKIQGVSPPRPIKTHPLRPNKSNQPTFGNARSLKPLCASFPALAQKYICIIIQLNLFHFVLSKELNGQLWKLSFDSDLSPPRTKKLPLCCPHDLSGNSWMGRMV